MITSHSNALNQLVLTGYLGPIRKLAIEFANQFTLEVAKGEVPHAAKVLKGKADQIISFTQKLKDTAAGPEAITREDVDFALLTMEQIDGTNSFSSIQLTGASPDKQFIELLLSILCDEERDHPEFSSAQLTHVTWSDVGETHFRQAKFRVNGIKFTMRQRNIDGVTEWQLPSSVGDSPSSPYRPVHDTPEAIMDILRRAAIVARAGDRDKAGHLVGWKEDASLMRILDRTVPVTLGYGNYVDAAIKRFEKDDGMVLDYCNGENFNQTDTVLKEMGFVWFCFRYAGDTRTMIMAPIADFEFLRAIRGNENVKEQFQLLKPFKIYEFTGTSTVTDRYDVETDFSECRLTEAHCVKPKVVPSLQFC